jgi:putative transposase
VYRRWEPRARNQVWEADHAQLDVEVLPLRGSRRVGPWLTVIEDGFSRLVMGWALSLQPTRAEVLAALREAIVVNVERGPWGGVPQLVRFDGGLEFLAAAVTRAAGEVGFAALQATHGRMRSWAAFTMTAASICDHHNAPCVDRQIARTAMDYLGSFN